MPASRLKLTLLRMDRIEGPWCLKINRAGHYLPVRALFATVSRLGDGIFWYGLMVLLPVLYGFEGLMVSLKMGLVGFVGLYFYKYVKSRTSRPRPFKACDEIADWVPPLDAFSFPSGHTLHAVAFTVLVVSFQPAFGWVLIPFTTLVAMSRVVLGLHYPSDVLMGASAGVLFSSLCLWMW
ncbi:phosphatase PAP2 family protein [Sulfidibacter corallicola]|uniref:Phosphatase PAP2 family protein n=1 Tax=Sulfidibacter corallicola TaxID=2818388 RepID=A0A8A4TW79_SULCO|nr:phosphatase PAP2 family protein [Sulfidibacter corallicola]QTD53431.1 phosphatase PAP2 family protein [Sulfidibacter corallicola]